jgi:hypothetical protein
MLAYLIQALNLRQSILSWMSLDPVMSFGGTSSNANLVPLGLKYFGITAFLQPLLHQSKQVKDGRCRLGMFSITLRPWLLKRLQWFYGMSRRFLGIVGMSHARSGL